MKLSIIRHLKIHSHIVKESIIDASQLRPVSSSCRFAGKFLNLQVSNPVARPEPNAPDRL